MPLSLLEWELVRGALISNAVILKRGGHRSPTRFTLLFSSLVTMRERSHALAFPGKFLFQVLCSIIPLEQSIIWELEHVS